MRTRGARAERGAVEEALAPAARAVAHRVPVIAEHALRIGNKTGWGLRRSVHASAMMGLAGVQAIRARSPRRLLWILAGAASLTLSVVGVGIGLQAAGTVALSWAFCALAAYVGSLVYPG